MPLQRNQRERFVRQTFDDIAKRYDLLNRVISFHLDTHWRKQTIKRLMLRGQNAKVLDLGTGTGDLALTAAKEIGPQGRIYGLDFSPEMLRLARGKRQRYSYGEKTDFILGSALEAPFRDNTFEAIMTAFVLRNVSDLPLFFHETYRLLRPGGRLATLDMFPPTRGIFSCFYSLYFYRLVPWIGAGLARHRSAYRYLSESVKGFSHPEGIAEHIRGAGFEDVGIERFLRGAVCLHVAEKPQKP